MSVNTSSRFGVYIEPRRDQSEEERARTEQCEQWAHLLAQSVVTQIPVNWADEAGSPNAWRTSDSALTLEAPVTKAGEGKTAGAASAQASGAGETGGAGGDGARLALSVDAGDLGELSLVVDRTKLGIRVTIGVADAAALNAVGPERAALERALAATGLSIESVRVVAQNGAGTVLAPSHRARSSDPAQRGEQNSQSENSRRRNARKLNLIG
ncbi:MAG TPA: hypothetical protein VI072_11755 [Polyangiaceae bacterium]